MSYEYMTGLASGLGSNGDGEQMVFTEAEVVTGEPPSAGDLRPLPPELQEDQPGESDEAPATEKQTWWTGDVEGMISGFFSKLGIGENARTEAQQAAREAAGETVGPTSMREIAPQNGAPPSVDVEPPAPWYIQYAPHMVIGGLGLGAVVTVILVMRKKD